MKLFCEGCQRILPAGGWSVIDGELRLRCGGCGAEAALARQRQDPIPESPPNEYAGGVQPRRPHVAVVPAAGAQAGAVATPPPPPREADDIDQVLAAFVAPTPGPAAAHAASLATRETEAALAVATAEPSMDEDPWLEIGWARLQQSWNDPAAHRRLIAEASARGDFSSLGMRYRDHLAKQPDDAVAVAARDELLQKATAELFTRLPAEEGGLAPARARVLRNLLLLIFFMGLVLFAGWVLLSMGGTP